MLGTHGQIESLRKSVLDRPHESSSRESRTKLSLESQDLMSGGVEPDSGKSTSLPDLKFFDSSSSSDRQENQGFLDITPVQGLMKRSGNLEETYFKTPLEKGEKPGSDNVSSPRNRAEVRDFTNPDFLPGRPNLEQDTGDPAGLQYLKFEGADSDPIKLAGSAGLLSDAVYRPGENDDLLHLARSRSKRVGGRSIGREAGRHQGSKMWRGSSYGKWTNGGRYGCAAAVSEVLQKAGVRTPDAGTVSQVDSSLRRQGWSRTPLGQRGPGCVVIGYKAGTNWRKGGGNAHVGIVDNRGRVCNNESKGGGIWKCESLSGAIRPKYNRKYVLCPPRR